jgi:hypothetical protein
MLKRIHDRLGTAGLIVGVIALVLALAGGAYAAKSGLTGKQKKEVKSIATSVAKPGPPGTPGAAGKDGANGSSGTNGSPGAAGKSIKLTSVAPGTTECEERGGALLKEEGSSAAGVAVCTGEEGSPWTAGGKLPPEATETGVWELSGEEGPAGAKLWAPISFTIPVAGGLEESKVHFQTEANFEHFDGTPGGVGCEGSRNVPTAPSGNLCVYYAPPIVDLNFLAITNIGRGGSKLANETGALLEFEREAPGGESPIAAGSFAVTG